MDIYLIKWYDAFSVGNWKSDEEMEKEVNQGLIIESIGFLFSENERYISLAQSSGSNENFSSMICIPKSCIIEKTKL